MDDIPPEIKGELRNRIRADLLRIHAKRLERADLRDCLRECYDTYVPDLRDAGWQLTEVLLSESIPRWVFQWAWVRGWLFATVRYARHPISEGRLADSVRNALSGRIAYWQAELLAPAIREPAALGTNPDVVDPDPDLNPDPAEERAREKREKLLARALGRCANVNDLVLKLRVGKFNAGRTSLYKWLKTGKPAAVEAALRRIVAGKPSA